MLRAMADLGKGPYPIADVAYKMGLQVGSLSPRRAKLIHKGMMNLVWRNRKGNCLGLFLLATM